MSCVIVYDSNAASTLLNAKFTKIQTRYNNLKKQMLNATSLNSLRSQKIKRIQVFLAQLNYNYAQYSPQKIEQILSDYTKVAAANKTAENLQKIASGSSSFLSINASASSDKKSFFQGLGQLFDLYKKARNGETNQIDADSFLYEVGQINRYLNFADGELKETGNLLGHIGAANGALLINNLIEALVQKPLTQSKAVTYSTGTKKTSITNQTITTDTMAVVLKSLNDEQLEVAATLRVSDKFNTKYRVNAKDTGSAVKLATRTVSTFLQGADRSYKDAYEFLLYNFLSYHKSYDTHWRREDWTKLIPKDWLLVRKAVAAELMYSELYGEGKGSFNFMGEEIQDTIDLYVYGNRLFLADDILKTLQNRKRQRDEFNAAQISMDRRNKLLMGYDIQSPPTEVVRKGGEEMVYQILSSSQITYSQKITFS